MKVTTIAAVLLIIGNAHAQERVVQIGDPNRTTMVIVTIHKWKDVRTPTSFVDVIVRDPEIADVIPLADHTLSILGKKIGSTRVSVYAENKKVIGSFDIDVPSDTEGRPKTR